MSDDKTQATFHGPGYDYNQHQLHVQHGWDYPPSAELDEHDGLLTQPISPRKSRTTFVLMVVLGSLIILITMAWASNLFPESWPIIGKDSGLAACEALAAGTKPTGQDKSLTAEEYKTMRHVFSGSRYPEIGEPGLKMVDLIWQFQGSDNKNDLGKALLLVGPMTQAYSSLAGGCAEHDIVIPALGQ